MAGYL